MPFTIGGDWVPGEPEGKEKDIIKHSRPVKVRKEKRRGSFVTVVLNLRCDDDEIKNLATELKRACACGGTVKERIIEVQGDKVDQVRKVLQSKGIKAQ
ncbi:hypothetical protein SCG7109_AS_00060 [Chlamydiales bacterium SCGC AG-110-M15]|nr:hypothetical protein SCG7109_AS_00060 [Chlamydiales bacterium SCGC AG-110-M15]